ncbi:cell wall-binding repeat-containing protein [Clostridium sp. PL3]|uniref:Cell wall-binding repeat-containing protein n=1 Tax=Clostridium thailandense TaxID=2794346 RepID=A0A949TH16_9CLOT|nr:cell wall-binding repeat-containing protein [Clostridium thailandense]MBV7272649.1 cell wall-binding repeat-containing protein [Clostridium thailandense]
MSKKSTKVLASATLMSVVLTTALSAGPAKAASGSVTRIGEADRYATAAKVATTNWTTNDNVVLVSGEGYADAVSASALAKKLNAPILLTTAGELSKDTESALSTLKAKNIYVIGGDASVSQAVRDELKSSYTLIELGGANRYETNAAVAQKLVDLGVDPSNVMMVGGEGFSDALSVAPIAAAKGQILLLGMNDANYIKPVLDFIKENNSKVTVVGTKNVISDTILNSFGGTRVDGGQDRFDTNLKVLAAFKDSVKMDKLYVATASYNTNDDGYADALVASALAGKSAAPLVLVDKEDATATDNAVDYIKTNATKTTDLNVIGGTGVVSDKTVDAINKAVNNQTGNGQATVASIEAVNLNQFKVHFNTAVDSDSAEDVTNYKVDGTQLTARDANGAAVDTNSAVAKAIDDNTVLITLAQARKQYDDVTVTVKKAILTADKSTTIDSFDQAITLSDTTVPTAKSVTVQGNSKLTVEFSEAVNMKDINTIASKLKIDGQSISNYGIDSDSSLTKIKDSIKVDTNTWANKVQFYFNSPIGAGDHTLNVSAGDANGILSDAAGFSVKETNLSFKVDTNSTKPAITSIEETASGEVHVTFDRPMDTKTALDAGNYELNGVKLSTLSGVSFDTDDNDCTIKIKGLSNIQVGANTLYVSNNIKDAYGNKVADDTRVNFNDIKDETKPTITSVGIIDSQTIRVRFSKDVDYSYATNKSNYKLEDNKGINITSHIAGIYSTSGQSDTSNTNTYDIKITKLNPQNSNDDWRLTGANYTLTIKNIIDTATTPNTMEDYATTLTGTDDVAPRATGVYYKQNSSSGKDQVVIYFTEAMDASTLTNKDNYKFVDGEGDTKALPGDVNITVGGDNKSAIVEFPTNYHVKAADAQGNTANTGISNDVLKIVVSNVKDEAGNSLDGVAYTSTIAINSVGTQVKANVLKVYYDGDDLKADVQFDKAIDNLNSSDFTLGGVTPTSASVSGDKVTLIFKDGDLATTAEKTAAPVITFANGKTNNDTNTTKIDLIKAQGQNAYLGIKASAKTTDETGAAIAELSNATANSQNTIYDYQAAPKTTSDYWTATSDANGGKVYVTFDTIIDVNSGIKTDDFTFTGANGTDLKADSVEVKGNTAVFTFNSTNKNIAAFTNQISVKAKSTASIRTERDVDGNYANYVPSSDDLKERTVTITASTN